MGSSLSRQFTIALAPLSDHLDQVAVTKLTEPGVGLIFGDPNSSANLAASPCQRPSESASCQMRSNARAASKYLATIAAAVLAVHLQG
jgi:hypothetical protein